MVAVPDDVYRIGCFDNLYPYQQRAVCQALSWPAKRGIFNEITGAGKTVESIAFLRAIGARNIRIAAPANVLHQWKDELDKYWPGHPSVGIIDVGPRKYKSKKKIAELSSAGAADIQITSHALMAKAGWLDEFSLAADAIVLDEIDLFQHQTSTMSKNARALVAKNPGAAVIGLTATMLANSPADFWNIGDILCPGRFGIPAANYPDKIPYHFNMRYREIVKTKWGTDWKGINHFHYQELMNRIASMSVRAPLAEVSRYLPSFSMRRLDIIGNELDAAVDWAKSHPGQKVILCYLRKDVSILADKLRGQGLGTVYHFTGDAPIVHRLSLIEQARVDDRSILVATLHSCGRGINGLSYAPNVLFAQLYNKPGTMVQAFGRFPRIGGQSSKIDVQVVANTQSEANYLLLKDKMEAINKVIPPGATESAFLEASHMTDDELQAGLLIAAASFDVDGSLSNELYDGDDEC